MDNRILKTLWTSFLACALCMNALFAHNWDLDEEEEPCIALSADLLVWSACQSDLDYAITDQGSGPGIGPTGILIGGNVHYIDFDWDAGFRLQAGYKMPWGSFTLNAIYTYWHVNEESHANAPPGGTLHANLFPAVFDSLAHAADSSAHLQLHYDTLDVLLATRYNWGSNFIARPYAGLRVLWLKERVHANYSGLDFAVGDFADWDVDLTAAGLTLGVRGSTPLFSGLQLIGHFGAAILAGEPNHHYRWFKATDPVATNTFLDLDDEHCLVCGEWDASLGLAYELCLCNLPIQIAIGYEVQDWWNMPRARRFFEATPTNDDHSGRLTLHGGFLRASFAF